MKELVHGGFRQKEAGGAIIAYLIVALVVMGTLASISSYVITNLQLTGRRQDMMTAFQYAQGGASLACQDVATAFAQSNAFAVNIVGSPGFYTKDSSRSVNGQLFFTRSITSPFTNQTVNLELSMQDSSMPSRVLVKSTATYGKSTQTVEAYMEAKFVGAAILSTHEGTLDTGVGKGVGQQGNAVIDGDSKGATVIDGSILANGEVNIAQATLTGTIFEQLYDTESRIPDYTDPGNPLQLFDFDRFTAVADKIGAHYTNLTHFIAAAAPGTNLEGVIVVDIPTKDKVGKLDAKLLPNGINVRGTLVFKFAPGWNPSDKLVNTAAMYINKADLSGLVKTNVATYPNGYPPVYDNPARKPHNVDLSSTPYDNFQEWDDLPALMYNNAILDIHGPVNICGAVYSPCFMEIENKESGAIQYFKGSIIGGGGIYVQGNNGASIVSYDANAVDSLATYGGRGKTVRMVYQK